MEVLVLGGLASVLALVSVRRRKSTTEASPDEGSSTKQPASPASNEYLMSLLIPCLVGAALFVIYYAIPDDTWIQFRAVQCREPSPEERAAQWDYNLEHSALKNVSHEGDARRLFSQGLLMRYGYSPEGARTSFSAASKVDPSCAMCYWGLAYAVAPFANIVALPDGTRHPYYSLLMNQEARGFLNQAQEGPFRSPRHRSYIDAMWIRFPYVQAVERSHQEWREFLYGAKMMSLWREDPSDVTAASLAAEAFINYRPWQYHTKEHQPSIDDMTWGDLIKATFPHANISEFESLTDYTVRDPVLDWNLPEGTIMEKAVSGSRMRPISRLAERIVLAILELDASHPMATHLHIHLLEATEGTEPNKAMTSALNLQHVSRQWKSGHLMHMPSHIYLRVGAYQRAVDVNIIALEIDIETSKSCVHPYVPEHNLKLLIAAASMGGLLKEAETYAWTLRSLRKNITMTGYISTGWEYVSALDVWGHFGQWEKILSTDPPTKGARGGSSTGGWEYSQVMYLYYRTLALSHTIKNNRRLLQGQDQMEYEQFIQVMNNVPSTQWTIPGDGIGIYTSPYLEKTTIASFYLHARNASLHGDLVGFIT